MQTRFAPISGPGPWIPKGPSASSQPSWTSPAHREAEAAAPVPKRANRLESGLDQASEKTASVPEQARGQASPSWTGQPPKLGCADFRFCHKSCVSQAALSPSKEGVQSGAGSVFRTTPLAQPTSRVQHSGCRGTHRTGEPVLTRGLKWLRQRDGARWPGRPRRASDLAGVRARQAPGSRGAAPPLS